MNELLEVRLEKTLFADAEAVRKIDYTQRHFMLMVRQKGDYKQPEHSRSQAQNRTGLRCCVNRDT